MAEHCPAPWRWDSTEEHGSFVLAADGQTIARVWANHPFDDGQWWERLQATGRLLSAAPELKEDLTYCGSTAARALEWLQKLDEEEISQHVAAEAAAHFNEIKETAQIRLKALAGAEGEAARCDEPDG